jgi:hypothetical protein
MQKKKRTKKQLEHENWYIEKHDKNEMNRESNLRSQMLEVVCAPEAMHIGSWRSPECEEGGLAWRIHAACKLRITSFQRHKHLPRHSLTVFSFGVPRFP